LESGLCTVQQTGLEKVLPQFAKRLQAMIFADVLTIDQQLMDTDRAIGLTAAAEQAAEGEVQLDGLWIDAHRLDEGVDGLVRLLVEQEVEAAQVGARQRT